MFGTSHICNIVAQRCNIMSSVDYGILLHMVAKSFAVFVRRFFVTVNMCKTVCWADMFGSLFHFVCVCPNVCMCKFVCVHDLLVDLLVRAFVWQCMCVLVLFCILEYIYMFVYIYMNIAASWFCFVRVHVGIADNIYVDIHILQCVCLPMPPTGVNQCVFGRVIQSCVCLSAFVCASLNM